MHRSKRRGSRVIYVARSARELPEEVQDWLSQGGNRAASSPDIYDALALLAKGRAPVALIVSIDAVDWNEMDFFVQAARLSRETRIYVTGDDHGQGKIDAACARGARRFDPDALTDDLDAASARKETAGPGGLLAGSLRTVRPPSRAGSEPQPQSEEDETEEPVADESPSELPPVRLLTGGEEEEDDFDAPISVPVPWAPSPNRPKRTPPPSLPRKDQAAGTGAAAPTPGQAGRPQQPAPVELTPEELAALLGKPVPPGSGSAKEQRQ